MTSVESDVIQVAPNQATFEVTTPDVTPPAVDALVERLGFTPGSTSAIAVVRLLAGERLTSSGLRNEGLAHVNLRQIGERLGEAGIRVVSQQVVGPSRLGGGTYGRDPIEYWVLGEGEEPPVSGERAEVAAMRKRFLAGESMTTAHGDGVSTTQALALIERMRDEGYQFVPVKLPHPTTGRTMTGYRIANLAEDGQPVAAAPRKTRKKAPAKKSTRRTPTQRTAPVAPNGDAPLADMPMPAFGSSLKVTGLVAAHDGTTVVHLQNETGTFTAELSGYWARNAG